MTLEPLARHWWMIAVRGAMAAAFGVILLAWSGVTLPIVVMLFAAYAMLDGVWTMAAAATLSVPSIGRAAVALEGLVSLGLGALALGWPTVPREFVALVAGWGLITGILEIIAAASLPGESAGHWLLGTAGVCSLFLAILVQMLPNADVASVILVIGIYALLFGVALALAAVQFRWSHREATAAVVRRRAA